MIYTSTAQLIGNTPLVELCNIEKEFGLCARLLAKVEFFNPAGSVKDRVALNMILEAEKSGKLTPDSVIIEPTSGNTGIGLASVAAAKGYRVIIVMPDTMSKERRMLMTAYGAQLVLSDGKKGMSGAIEKAKELEKQIPGAFIAGQFTSPANPGAHFMTTGPEIWRDTEGKVDIFIAGAGTGGTVTGVGKHLKSQNPDVEIIAFEPDTSAVLSGDAPGAHKLQGIGAGFVPEILDTSVIDKVMRIKDDEAYEFARLTGKKEGLLVGITSGAAVCAAVKTASLSQNKGKTIVALLPDGGDRYLSSGLFE